MLEGDKIKVAQGENPCYLLLNQANRHGLIAGASGTGKTVTVDVKVGDEGILFGSVTAAMIADAIKAQLGMDIDRKRVELGKPIKVAGAHTVAISLYREIKAEVVVLVGVTAEELAAEAEVEEAAEVAEAETAEVETEAAAE